MQNRKTLSVYGLLFAVWLVFAVWQGFEHVRIANSEREKLLSRAREIGRTLGIVIRVQRFFNVLWQPRLEATLAEMVAFNKVQSVMLLNASGDVVTSAGLPIDLNLEDLPKQEARWSPGLVTFFDLVPLGDVPKNEQTSQSMAIVLNPPEGGRRPRGNSAPEGAERHRDNDPDRRRHNLDDGPPPGPPEPPGPPSPWADLRPSSTTLALIRAARDDRSTTAAEALERMRRENARNPRNRRPQGFFRRPPWIDEAHYRELQAKRGLHGFVLQMPTATCDAAIQSDLWIRFTTLVIGLLAVGGLGFARRNMERMTRLQLRLLRASEMNAHLQELNVASAGLAHETRNPLNIVRGLAQLISQSAEAGGEIRQKAESIASEVDRVTGRLNEFINYSRTPEPRPAPTALQAVIADVQRALESDQADKDIQFRTRGPELTVEADESLLRQVIFNLLLNAFQSVGHGGRVEVTVQGSGDGEAFFEVRDDGPGVPPDLRKEIFKPYFSTRSGGTGLGLAVVRQIVLAHHWEIEYLSTETGGADFRVSGLKVL